MRALVLLEFLLVALVTACDYRTSPVSPRPTVARSGNSPAVGERDVGLSKIELFSPKGRVQDREYNPRQPVIDALIERGKQSIPLLIEMLNDDTTIDNQIVC